MALALVPAQEDATVAKDECPGEVWFRRCFWPVPKGGAGYVHWKFFAGHGEHGIELFENMFDQPAIIVGVIFRSGEPYRRMPSNATLIEPRR